MNRFNSTIFACIFILLPNFSIAQDSPVINVSGYATVNAIPDMATITLGAETQARQAVDAMRQNNTAMADLFAVIKDAGIADKDMQTSGLSLDPQYQHSSGNTPKLVGYVARNQVTVYVRDLTVLGGVIDAAVGSGSNAFFGLSFGLQNPEDAQDIALAQAVARARTKAEIMADAAGVTLGKLVGLSESGGMSQPSPMRRDAVMAMEAVPVAEGSVGVSATAHLVFEILQ